MEKVKRLVLSKLPTRILLVASPNLLSSLVGREFLEIAHVTHSFPFSTTLGQKNRTSHSVSLMLAINKESMSIDLIDWPAFKEDLVDWANKHCPNLNIDSNTDSRFRERLVPSHSPRALAHGINEIPCIYQLFSPVTPNHESVKEMVLKGVPIHMANLIYKISKHNPLLSAVGILPNQLRSILKETTHNFDEASMTLHTLYFSGLPNMENTQNYDV
jgi:hypothetical protein